jgi:hypothetical protein
MKIYFHKNLEVTEYTYQEYLNKRKMKSKQIKIGDTLLPETINLDGKEARLIIFPKNKKWNMEYVHFDKTKKTFSKFANEVFSFQTIEDAATSMRNGLLINGYIK